MLFFRLIHVGYLFLSSTGAMVAAILKIYLIGTALTVLAGIFGILDSFGGLMYVLDERYTTELGPHTRRRSAMTKRIGS